jgi:hypothetical protein
MADKSGLDRREFLRRAAVTTAAAAWAAPVIQTVAASPAFASTNGTPAPGGCFHSNADPAQSCMDACTSACGEGGGELCDGFGGPPGEVQGPCAVYCGISPGNQCCNPGLCNSANFQCTPGVDPAVYTGDLTGC